VRGALKRFCVTALADLVELSTQVDRAAGDVEGFRPVREALFLDCDLMAAGGTDTVEGVLPTNASSISMSAPDGVESMTMFAVVAMSA